MIPKDFQNALAPNLGRTVKLMEHRVDDMLASNGFDLTKMQFILLLKLKDHIGVSQNDLAFFSNRNKSSLARAINTLEKKNYLARIPSEEDKRVNQLFITKKGLAIIKDATPVFMEVFEIIQKGISPEEIEQTINILKRIQSNIMEGFNDQAQSNKDQ
ncbi:MarR family winged helix-turn-helix transcriptional regulator [Crocinitomix catalasitica]|uniref:MarR family winged helix-turn-helix transcriptional regulator n=1 Tax=Crocinitomix catalasitica TaxID=184607 RepID=UPI00068747A1|nr:MarR family transcriptional regulator [Crocinitomix catalasitica]